MTRKAATSPPAQDDSNSHDEDTPAWTDDQLDRAELAVGGKVVRPANGTLTRPVGVAGAHQCGPQTGDRVAVIYYLTQPGIDTVRV